MRFFLFLTLYLITAKPVYAYLDPGTGSYIAQLIIAFILGGAFTLKIYWRKIKNWINDKINKKKDEEVRK